MYIYFGSFNFYSCPNCSNGGTWAMYVDNLRQLSYVEASDKMQRCMIESRSKRFYLKEDCKSALRGFSHLILLGHQFNLFQQHHEHHFSWHENMVRDHM